MTRERNYKVWFVETYPNGEGGMHHSVNVAATTREEAVASAREYLNRLTEDLGDALIDAEGSLPVWVFSSIQAPDGDYELHDGEWIDTTKATPDA